MVLRTRINTFDRYYFGLGEIGRVKSTERIKVYFITIPAHKYLHIKNYESNGYWDFWEKQDAIPGVDCDTICTYWIASRVRKNKCAIQSAVTSATEKAQEVSDIIKLWGNDDNSPETRQQNTELLQRVQSSQKLRDIIKYLGKYRKMLDNTRKISFTYGRGDKYDIVLGNDFTRAVSSECAYLALPETVPLFIQKVQHKALKQYRKREPTGKGYGDIVVCVDESGSMEGDAIVWQSP